MITIFERAPTVEEYLLLRRSVGWRVPEAGTCEAPLARSLFSVVAHEADNGVVAMVRLVGDGLYALVADAVVIPDFQGRGLGRRLVARVVDWAERQGIQHIAVAADNTVAEFYLRGAFEDCGTRYLRLRAPK
ncbi:GNAT family N-acetyltransferase [Nocardia altamirensis]|uniref:GNAT family N-acetyltransferase n=1 Tax=Nocardia altamirensis TaxID=472158 RepID=UPI00083FEE36|nr:GNAT family N-acetyltransferase [Nocardia altamirensis]